jgi:hypothetical protein
MRHYILSAAVTLGCTVAAGAESVRERTSTEMKTGSEVLGIDPSRELFCARQSAESCQTEIVLFCDSLSAIPTRNRIRAFRVHVPMSRREQDSDTFPSGQRRLLRLSRWIGRARHICVQLHKRTKVLVQERRSHLRLDLEFQSGRRYLW